MPQQATVPVAATPASIDTVPTRGSVCGRGYGKVQQRGDPRVSHHPALLSSRAGFPWVILSISSSETPNFRSEGSTQRVSRQ